MRNGSFALATIFELEAAALDGERERALHLLAGAHAARADDAACRIELEIRVRRIDARTEMVGATLAVADAAQPDLRRRVLQLVVTDGGRGEGVEGMVGKIELHHPATQLPQPVGMGRDLHPGGDRRRAGGGRAGAPLDFHQAQPA